MLRHPFYGVLQSPYRHDGSTPPVAPTGSAHAPDRRTPRRTFFAQATAALLGAASFALLGRRSAAQDSFNPGGTAGGSFDKGFSGQSKGSFRGGLGGDSFGDPGPRYNGGGGTVTTYAIGEEGSGGRVTTYALGEEGSGGPTTRALGEEGGRPPGGGVTTYALGEEGSYPRYQYYYRYPNRRRPTYTTYAVGEEGSWRW